MARASAEQRAELIELTEELTGLLDVRRWRKRKQHGEDCVRLDALIKSRRARIRRLKANRG